MEDSGVPEQNLALERKTWSADAGETVCCSIYYFIYFLKITLILKIFKLHLDFPSGPGVKNLPANAGDTDSIPSPEESHMLQATKLMHHDLRV